MYNFIISTNIFNKLYYIIIAEINGKIKRVNGH